MALAALVASAATMATTLASAPAADAQAADLADLLVAPTGARVVTSPTGQVVDDGVGNFLEQLWPEGDFDVMGRAIGVVERGEQQVFVTVLRLGTARQASEALSRVGTPDGPVRGRPPIEPDTVARFVEDDGSQPFGIDLYEVARATGNDLVMMAQIRPLGDGPSDLVRDTMRAHLAAFPAVTPPSTDPWTDSGLPWVPIGMVVVGLGAVAFVVLRLLPGTTGSTGRPRPTGPSTEGLANRRPNQPPTPRPTPTSSPDGTDAGTSSTGARVVW